MIDATIPPGFRPAELDKFLGELIGGQGMDRAVAHTGGDGLALRKFARECGFPSRSTMREARAALAGLVPTPVPTTPVVHGGETRVEEPDRKTAPAPAVDQGAAPAETASVPQPAILESAVAAVKVGRASTSRAVRAAAERFEKAHADLVRGIHDHAEQQAHVRRVAELTAELARLRGQKVKKAAAPRPGGSSTTPTPGATVRAWAAEQGVECPTHGRIPQAVQQAYDAWQAAADA